jgi:hypothetical protein
VEHCRADIAKGGMCRCAEVPRAVPTTRAFRKETDLVFQMQSSNCLQHRCNFGGHIMKIKISKFGRLLLGCIDPESCNNEFLSIAAEIYKLHTIFAKVQR